MTAWHRIDDPENPPPKDGRPIMGWIGVPWIFAWGEFEDKTERKVGRWPFRKTVTEKSTSYGWWGLIPYADGYAKMMPRGVKYNQPKSLDAPAVAAEMTAGNKYGAQKSHLYGIDFASKREANRYLILRAMEADGSITDLELQPRYELIVNGVLMTGCPNCGSSDCDIYGSFSDDSGVFDRWFGRCDNCGFETGEYHSEDEALAAWQMPAARADAAKEERARVLAEVRGVIAELVFGLREGAVANSASVAFMLIENALDKMETGK